MIYESKKNLACLCTRTLFIVLNLSLSLSLSLCLCLSLPLSRSHSLTLSLTLSLFFTLSHSLRLLLSLFLSLTHSLSLSHSLSVSTFPPAAQAIMVIHRAYGHVRLLAGLQFRGSYAFVAVKGSKYMSMTDIRGNAQGPAMVNYWLP